MLATENWNQRDPPLLPGIVGTNRDGGRITGAANRIGYRTLFFMIFSNRVLLIG